MLSGGGGGGGLRWLPTEGMADKGTNKQRRMKNHRRERPTASTHFVFGI